MSVHSLRIGLLTHTQLQQRTLRLLVEECGHQVGKCLLISELERQPLGQQTLGQQTLVQQTLVQQTLNQQTPNLETPNLETPKTPNLKTRAPLDDRTSADAWIVAVDGNASDAPAAVETALSQQRSNDEQPSPTWLDTHWLDRQSAPVIFCDGTIPATHDGHYAAWARRLTEKLNHLAGTINLAQAGQRSAKQVWVLAASTGGPAAVKQFLCELPPGLGVGFIYVQHIDTGFKDTLAQVMSRGSHYPAHVVEHGSLVRPNEVAIVSPDHATELLSNGTFVVHRRAWSAPYRPSADYIVANVAHRYRERSGVIIFTGMGNDGAVSSRLMRQKGGKVWVQTPASCTSDSMPAATLAAGCVDFKGNPPALARELIRTVHQQSALEMGSHL